MVLESEIVHLFSQTFESYRGIHPGSDGKGDNWSVWYTRWLLDVSDLPELLQYKPQPDELQKKLISMDKNYTRDTNISWQEYMGSQLYREYFSSPNKDS